VLGSICLSHNAVYLRVHVYSLKEAVRTSRRWCKGATTVPYAAYLISGNDLCEQSGRYMPHFDEAGVKQNNIRPMYRHAFSRALPLDSTCVATRHSVFVDVDAEF